jgi:hypothetical protein
MVASDCSRAIVDHHRVVRAGAAHVLPVRVAVVPVHPGVHHHRPAAEVQLEAQQVAVGVARLVPSGPGIRSRRPAARRRPSDAQP